MVEDIKIQKGYKQTEIGIIPSDWEVEEIQDVAKITTGTKNTQDRIKGGKYPFFVRSQTVERINSYSFNGEAILTAGDGVGTGKVFHYINGKFDFHQRVYSINNFSDRLNGYFFYKYFSANFYNRIMQMTAKSSVDSVRRGMISKMLIPIPKTKEEQISIATALSDMDNLIEGLEKLLVKKRNIKQGAMHKLLKPKNDWEETTLGEMLKYEQPTKFLVKSTDYNSNSGVPVLTAGKSFILGYTNEISGIYKNLPVILFDDFTTSSQFVNFNFKVKSSALKILKIKSEKFNIIFLFSLMQLIKFDSTDHKRYWISEYQNIKIKVPTSEEQTLIANVLYDMDNEIKQLETKLSKYKMLKIGMMQELLTGKKRLI